LTLIVAIKFNDKQENLKMVRGEYWGLTDREILPKLKEGYNLEQTIL